MDYISGDFVSYDIKNGLGYEFFESMQKHKNKVAQILTETGEKDTFGDVLSRSIRTSLKLQSKGIQKGDVICICSNNHKNSIIPLIAALFLNAKFTSLDPGLSQEEIAYMINLVKPKIFFVVPEAVTLINNALDYNAKIVVFSETAKESFNEYLKADEREKDFYPEKINNIHETAAILFSSGSTGFPKGICLGHYALLWQFHNYKYLGFTHEDSVFLGYATSYWITGIIHIGCSMLHGATRVVPPRFQCEDFWQILESYKVTYAFLASFSVIELLNHNKSRSFDISSLSIMMTGGSPLPDSYFKSLQEMLPNTFVVKAYGQTETCGPAMVFNINNNVDKKYILEKGNSVGKPMPGVCCKIVNLDSGKPCKPFEIGELFWKTKLMMNGYYKSDSSEFIDDNGWLRSGDLLYYDEDNCLYFVDRMREMLKCKDHHIFPCVIESKLCKNPAIKQAIVFGIGRDYNGDLPVAVIVPNYPVDVEEIEQWCKLNLGATEQLRGGIKLMKEFPLTPSGKIKRESIKDLVLAKKI